MVPGVRENVLYSVLKRWFGTRLKQCRITWLKTTWCNVQHTRPSCCSHKLLLIVWYNMLIGCMNISIKKNAKDLVITKHVRYLILANLENSIYPYPYDLTFNLNLLSISQIFVLQKTFHALFFDSILFDLIPSHFNWITILIRGNSLNKVFDFLFPLFWRS